LPPSEVFTLLLPQFNGVLDHYWGSNPIKFHTEYMGALPLVLAAFAFGDKTRRTMAFTLAGFALFFLLLSFAGHTPFYRPFYEFMPLLKKIRAMGMVFYLPAFFVCILAGIGAERVFARTVSMKTVLGVGGVVVLFALLGAVGGLQGLAESLAINERYEAVVSNAPYLQSGAVRLLLFAVAGLAVLALTVSGKLARPLATGLLAAVVALDLWSVNKEFYTRVGVVRRRCHHHQAERSKAAVPCARCGQCVRLVVAHGVQGAVGARLSRLRTAALS
jgi:hypothetical protein